MRFGTGIGNEVFSVFELHNYGHGDFDYRRKVIGSERGQPARAAVRNVVV